MWSQTVSAGVAGLLFGCGLAISGMTDPLRVLGFLDVIGRFNPQLLCVLAAAVTTTLIMFRIVLRLRKPLLEDRFDLPTRVNIDAELLAGAAIFGVGWGVAGYCPGPALASLGALSRESLIFVPAMFIGALLFRGSQRVRRSRESRTDA